MRKVKKEKWLVVLMVVAMLFGMVPAMAGAGVNQEMIIYGVVGDGSSGSLWMIDPTVDPISEVKIVDIPNVNGANVYYPNGLAFDEDNNRLYFAIREGTNNKLYYYDLDSEEFELAAENVPGAQIYGATWGAGKYWYIPNGTSNMYAVSFDVDGVNGIADLFEGNFTGDNKSFNLGDMALDAEENVIYVSTSFSGSNKEFFKYDLNEAPGDRYELIATATKAVGLQLGFGTGGVLYGHNTFGEFPAGTKGGEVEPMEWFEVGIDGTATSLGVGVNEYNDLSSGPVIEPSIVCETAWAYGGVGEDQADEVIENNSLPGTGNAWGWTNKVGDAEHYEFPLYIGAAQNDLDKGKLVGTVIVHVEGENSWVKYEIGEDLDCWFSEVHLWIGDTELPETRRGNTAAPGQFEFKAYPNDTWYEFDFDAGNFDDNFWVAAHAVVCCYEVMED